MKIKDIELILLDVPFHPVPQRNMERTNHGWRIVEICRVTTDNGLVGIGETLPNYTWCRCQPQHVERARGGNPFELMWDDTLGAGLQMALFDVAGKAAGVPVYRLLGNRCRDHAPISWWGIDMPPEDYAAEAKSAVEQGYASFKQKARPWFDVWEQIRQTTAEVGPNFKLDFDFNEHLNNAASAVPVLKELDLFGNIAIYEEPIPRGDVEGYRQIRRHSRSAIALHYVSQNVVINVREEMCDGYVVCAGASAALKAARLCQEAKKLFWYQLVGTGITTTWMAHLAAVSPAAQWPAVTCMNMYVDPLVTRPLRVCGGYVAVPQAPGLGIEFNEAALKYRVQTSEKPNADALYAIARDTGQKIWFHGEYKDAGYWTENWAGNLPPFEHGVTLIRRDNDGSKEWKDLAARVKAAPVWE